MMTHRNAQIRFAIPGDREALARLIRDSTNSYYVDRLGRDPIFPADNLSTTAFVDLYEALEGSRSLVYVENEELLGSCFYHERDTHVSLGIMNVHGDHFGKGIAKRLLSQVLDRAEATGKPTRLVSSCLNIDSYSLYTQAGFSPFEFFQDIVISVPAEGFALPAADDLIRKAEMKDIEAMAELEFQISGISRRNDYRHFIANPDGLWDVSLAIRENAITGFLASNCSDACNMIGPGVALDEDTAFALQVTQLNMHHGRTPVLLVPGRYKKLIRKLYDLGGRNCELHVAQSTEPTAAPNGIVMPSFFPESG